jgi:hypothetical protein
MLMAAALCCAATAARAETVPAAQLPEPQVLLEPRAGWTIRSGPLGSSPAFALQGGKLLRGATDLWVIAELGYARPTMRNSSAGDAPGAGFDYRLAANDVSLLLGARKAFAAPLRKLPALSPFVEGGLKLHLVYTTESASTQAQGALGPNHESTVLFGLAARGGAAYAIGPGALTLTLEFAYTRFTQTITGKSNVFGLSPALGFAWWF